MMSLVDICKKYNLEARMLAVMPPVWALIGDRALEALPEIQEWDHPLGAKAATEIRCFRSINEFEANNPGWPESLQKGT